MPETSVQEPVKDYVETVEFKNLESLLQQHLGNKELRVVNCSTTKLLPPGENYSSTMIKLDITFRRNNNAAEEKMYLVGKAKNPTEKQFCEWAAMLKRELFVYAELMPVYRELEREAGVKDNDLVDVTPTYIGLGNTLREAGDDLDDGSVLLLNNLKIEGYYNCDRHTGLDVNHASLALTFLARYHALGIAMKQKRPEFAKKVITDVAKMPEFEMEPISEAYKNNLNIFRETSCLSKHITVIEEYYSPYVNGKAFVVETEQGPWTTITHGDCWVNNMLFQKDAITGEVAKVKFVDFQMYLHASPLRDLPYFFCSSLDDATVANHFVDLLDLYYQAFVESLVRLGCDAKLYTKEAFDIELKKQALIVFPVCALAMKFIGFKVEEKDANNKELITSVFNDEASEAYVRSLRRLNTIYEDRGWF